MSCKIQNTSKLWTRDLSANAISNRPKQLKNKHTPCLPPPQKRTTKLNAAAAVEAPSLTAAQREAEAERALREGLDDIYGIPRAEWLNLNKPASYLGNEFGAVHKPWKDAEVRFSLTYPEIYEVGASNLGHIVLYSVLNQQQGLLCDRAYFPAPDMKEMLAKHGKPLFAVENRRPLLDFDILGFSLAYELGGTNIIEMLKLAGIPATYKERASMDIWGSSNSVPLIFAGGPTATSNPEPFSDFFDFFALGDGEELLVEIGHCLRTCKAEGLNREDTLFRLATTVEGVYVPQFYDAPAGWGGAVFPIKEGVPERIKRRTCAPDPFQQIGLVPFVSTVHDRLTVEIRRGCTRGCRFCQPGMLTRPARDVDPETVVEAVEHGMKLTGYNEFSLLSLSCSDYLSLPAVGLNIKNRLKEYNVSLSLPSQRVDRFDENIANIISNAGKKSGLTFAPEAGTQRLRDVINKGLTNEELLRGVKSAWDQGWKQVKLYFMIGLPGETDEDVLGIARTIEWLQKECRQGRWHLAVNVTISNFTPKPATPFQWHTVSTSEFRRKQDMLRTELRKLHQVKANFTPVSISAMEDFIARGDRRIGAVIRRAWELGATNDGWWQTQDKNYEIWTQAINECDLSWKYRQIENGEWDVLEVRGDGRYRKQGGGGKGRIDRGELADKRLDAPLPWDHIDTGISKNWLKSDLQKALEAATVPDCSHSGICSECGVCGDEFGENVVFEPPPIPKFEGHYKPNSTKAQRLRFKFTKLGDLVFIGHLDLMTLFDRAVRRAFLPVSTDESPFAARQRIYTALALPLGATSSSEYLELFLTREMDPENVKHILQEQLPMGLNLLEVNDVGVYKMDGSLVETMGQLLVSAEYIIAVRSLDDKEVTKEVLEQFTASVLASERLVKKPKGGKKQTHKKKGGGDDNARPSLLSLEVMDTEDDRHVLSNLPWEIPAGSQLLRLKTACIAGNPVWSPASLVDIANGDFGQQLEVARVHRTDVELGEPAKPKVDYLKLRSLCRQDGHFAAARRAQVL